VVQPRRAHNRRAAPARRTTEREVDENAKSASWHELIPPGEAAQFDECIRAMTRYQQGFARRGDGQAHRGFHVKSHAGLNAKFSVLDDIPPAAKHGVFKEARTFPAWVRLTNGFSAAQPDWFPDLLGFAVKLFGVEGPKLMTGQEHSTTQDFLALNHSEVPADDAVQMMLMAMSAPINAPAFTLAFDAVTAAAPSTRLSETPVGATMNATKPKSKITLAPALPTSDDSPCAIALPATPPRPPIPNMQSSTRNSPIAQPAKSAIMRGT